MSASKLFFFLSLSIFTIIFSGLYQGALLVGYVKGKDPLLVSKLTEIINLLKLHRLQVVTDDDQWSFFRRVNSSDGDFFRRLNKIFSERNYLKVNSEDEVYKQLMTGKYIYPTFSTNFWYKKERCGLGYMILKDEPLLPCGFVFRKNSSFLPLMNRAIANSWDMIAYYNDFYQSLGSVNHNCSKNAWASSVSGLTIINFMERSFLHCLVVRWLFTFRFLK